MKDRAIYDKLVAKTVIDEKTGCWNWTGFCDEKRPYPGNRYGQVTLWNPITKKSSSKSVHRAMWIALHGAPPKDICVCHTCDNPKCCNPDHLWLGTRRENTLDMVKKNRHHLKKLTHCKRGHKLYGENIYVHKGLRHCKLCQLIKQRIYAGWTKELAESLPKIDRGMRKKITASKAGVSQP